MFSIMVSKRLKNEDDPDDAEEEKEKKSKGKKKKNKDFVSIQKQNDDIYGITCVHCNSNHHFNILDNMFYQYCEIFMFLSPEKLLL